MTLQYVSTPAPVSRETGGELGGACLGQPNTVLLPGWPVQRIFAPLLGGTAEVLHETWLCSGPFEAGVSEEVSWRRAGDVLFGVIELDEARFASVSGKTALQAASEEAYDRIFRLLDAQGLPQLWRVWNYLAAINEESDGLERYRQFNVGRQDAFVAYHRGTTGNVPAACALGVSDGPLSIAFMAGKTAAVPVENPRQVSAYNYPSEYGPRSPTFSRASLVYPPGQEILFISGTASIVGHRTVHLGDVSAQTSEAMTNIAAVVGEANRITRGNAYALSDLSYRVYIRHAGDFAAVQAALAPLIGIADTVYVQADICRADLLVEIEAMASQSMGSC